MPNPPTPGQVAYDTWRVVLLTHSLQHWLPYAYATWNVLQPREQHAWEAAAAAVLAPRRTEHAAQLHQLIDALVAHAAPVLLDKVHLWLSDVTASAHHPLTILQEGDEGA